MFQVNESIVAKSLDSDLQEHSDLELHCLTKRLVKHYSRQRKQKTFVVICTLRINSFALGMASGGFRGG